MIAAAARASVRAAVVGAAITGTFAWHLPGRAHAAQEPQFRSGVDVVELNVMVYSGRSVVADLRVPNFEVIDNGVSQQVISVNRESLPIDVTMVIDTSESLTEALVRSIVSGVNRIRERLRPDDRVSIVAFNHRIQERLARVPPPAAKAIDLGRPAGQTSLRDAIAVVMAQQPIADRRQMAIVFTDGFDSTSFLTVAETLEVAGRSRTTVFVVARGFGTSASPPPGVDLPALLPGLTVQPPNARVGFFEKLTDATGGFTQIVSPYTTVRTENSVRMTQNDNFLEDSFLKAFEDFRTAYVVRYNLGGVPRKGWHAVKVNIVGRRGSLQVRTRTGYIG